MANPLVSILTTTYNHERFIGTCVESVLKQTYPHWEQIIIDDGSTDRTGDVIARYKDPRIKYHLQENRGFSQLGNMYASALQQTKGELVTILSGDDAWPPYRLEKQVPIFEEENVVACFGRGVIIDECGRELPRVPRGEIPYVLNRPVGSVLSKLLVENFLPSYTYLISRKALERMGGFQQPPGVVGVDSPTILNLALQGEFRFIDVPLGYWRVHSNQQTGQFRMQQAFGDTNYALAFFRSLDDTLKIRAGWTEEALQKVFGEQLRHVDFEIGRRLLLCNNRRQALRYFLNALGNGALPTKLKALVGLSCGLFRIDLERVIRLAGRTALK